MAKYLIVAYEEMYGGMHGMEDWICVETDYDDAVERGYEMATVVIESYSNIMDDLASEAAQKFKPGTEEYYDYLNELIEEDALFEIHELRDDTPIDLVNHNIDNWETILEEYGMEDNK